MAAQKTNESGERLSRRREKNASPRPSGQGLAIDQVFSTSQVHPFDDIEWETRTAHIGDDKGKVIFQQTGVEAPSAWSQLATNVVVSKYFYGDPASSSREKSIRTLIHRVTRTIADWGKADGMFATVDDAERFYQELTFLCVNQYGSFNSPVWFNVGLFHQAGVKGSEGNYHWDAKAAAPAKTMHGYEYPQASACFIQSVADTMEDIMRLCHAEAMLFKYGSGTGTDLSTLRSSREKLSGGGTPSGPLSFMRVFDQIAAVVKSGGKTRRAAKMQSLRCDHPDIKEFIECKMNEERKAWALIEQGYDGSFNGEAYSSVMYQNANLSIRATDEFMQAAIEDLDWQTVEVTSKKPSVKYKAKDLLGAIAEGTHVCGDPGVQFHTTINRWHTCKADGEICASNPCSEYMFLNDSACNLASLNLMKFRREDGSMDIERFRAAARLFVIAQDILVDHASYPSDRICANSHYYRPLGLGYANLGALLMSLGMPYDGDAGRATAAAITAIMTGTAYAASSEMASGVGTFDRFEQNRRSMLDVMAMHRRAVETISPQHCREELIAAARSAWDEALDGGARQGYRNAQVSVLAPTGTIGFMMDCDTTGIEPDIALVKYKQLAGGGMFKLVNQTVPLALKQLGYSPAQIAEIIEYIDEHDTIEDAPHVLESHLPVFDCAFKPANGRRCIHYMGHIRMMGAVQPFISGAISKTVNIPNEATIEQIKQVYTEAWKLGIKAVAIYRDGSKRTQPLNVRKEGDKKVDKAEKAEIMTAEALAAALDAARRQPHRNRLPATRPSMTHKFDVAGHEGYLNVGLYANGEPGELFITMAKEGSTVGGMMDAFATAISLCLQYGVPLDALVKKFTHQRFEPSGMTSNRDIPFAKSIVDYIFRWLGLTFLEEYRKANLPDRGTNNTSPAIPRLVIDAAPEAVKDDKPSEPGRADRTSDTDDQRSGGALLDGSYVGSVSMPKSPSKGREKAAATAAATEKQTHRVNRLDQLDKQFSGFQEDAPACDVCGAITVRNGNCYKCYNCGSSLGCS
ncbi:MAG: vitamin B12-dependent ribonucleotide reductase [Planctomycetaceae bacterium]|nr:vitamin B12-dependent ribonucleotide reductase [Planctomycetaceae bacterium]